MNSKLAIMIYPTRCQEKWVHITKDDRSWLRAQRYDASNERGCCKIMTGPNIYCKKSCYLSQMAVIILDQFGFFSGRRARASVHLLAPLSHPNGLWKCRKWWSFSFAHLSRFHGRKRNWHSQLRLATESLGRSLSELFYPDRSEWNDLSYPVLHPDSVLNLNA